MFDLRQRKNGRPLLVGHRGAMDAAPENTFPAFEAGWAGGADILELDVQLTADQEVIVFHDHTLKPKTGQAGEVHEFTAAYLQSLDVGRYFGEQYAGTRMPLLQEVLAWAKGRVPLMVEIKQGPHFDERLNAATVHLIEAYEMEEEVVVISFDQFALRTVKELNPNITTGFNYVGRLLDPLAQLSGLKVDSLSPATDFLTLEEVQLIQKAGYPCSPGGSVWDYATLLRWNVDSISSNDPASFDWAAYGL